MTIYIYYTSLMPKRLIRELVVCIVLLTLVAGIYSAMALGIEIPAVNSLIHEFVQGLVKP